MSARILLDYDGVILRSARATHYQFSQSVKFMYTKLNKTMSLVDCARANARYYPVHGHTVHMMNRLYDADVTLAEYNEFVFGKIELKRNALDDTRVLEDMAEFGKFVRVCKNLDVPVAIFTNAHPNWVSRTALGAVCNLPVIHPEDNLSLLKPAAEAYKRVNASFPGDSFVFIDDSADNCVAAETHGDGLWSSVVFDGHIDSTLATLLKTIHSK
jgi:FMN phosphatase YigB (HAD superfamily)